MRLLPSTCQFLHLCFDTQFSCENLRTKKVGSCPRLRVVLYSKALSIVRSASLRVTCGTVSHGNHNLPATDSPTTHITAVPKSAGLGRAWADKLQQLWSSKTGCRYCSVSVIALHGFPVISRVLQSVTVKQLFTCAAKQLPTTAQ